MTGVSTRVAQHRRAPAPAPTPSAGGAAQLAAPAHVLLGEHSPPDPTGTPPGAGMGAREQADRILASLLRSEGPILLCMPGTLGGSYQHAMFSTAQAAIRQHGGAIAVASIPYPNSIVDAVTRFFGANSQADQSPLALVIRGLKRNAPHRPILLVGESQGSWVIAQNLRDPELAGAITRVVLFSKPGFVRAPTAVGQAAEGAGLLPGTPGVIQIRHDDDIVPALIGGIVRPKVVGGFVGPLRNLVRTGEYHYPPHDYSADGEAAARYLLTGQAPTALVHSSSDDRNG